MQYLHGSGITSGIVATVIIKLISTLIYYYSKPTTKNNFYFMPIQQINF